MRQVHTGLTRVTPPIAQALEMGARTYLPVLGRFLQTDPILAGALPTTMTTPTVTRSIAMTSLEKRLNSSRTLPGRLQAVEV